MGRNNLKATLRAFVKICLSGIALLVVIRNIDIHSAKNIFLGADIAWLLPALIAFNFSKIISAFRLNSFFRMSGLTLDRLYNLKLYYVGMFYNLFLPGGIGGDGYKVYLLNKYFKSPLKTLVSASLLDRISGMTALVFLASALLLTVDVSMDFVFPGPAVWVLVIMIYPTYYIFQKYVFRKFNPVFFQSAGYSLIVQCLQLVSAYCILRSLGVNEHYTEYQVLFLVSSAVAVLPVTIGGVGARELVFVIGSNFLGTDKNTAIAFSLIFFLITVISSFTGIFFKTRPGMKISL
ncbi:MAG TPA: lysylphosphatidylglycerol synthase transmembrane domain-containing protein [Cyclobacteriaceae bacterium]|nr:lysylphosphatidylglycerol synthase transmembrane domain-containing protein [Cyclobacteriaceae bacterium]